MKKTPVSILQEMMVKKGGIPNYELIFNGGGTHQNIFTYQVSCEGLKASGTGRCKKDAKHEAATAMLEAIAKQNALPQLPASPCASPVRTPLPMTLPVCPKSPANVPFRNTIGELQDLCSTNNLDDPEYKERGDVGPAHARVFTVQCLVSTFIEEGIATTKKRAKHEAARKMINRIMIVVADGQIKNFSNQTFTNEQIQSKIAIARYQNLVNSESIKSKVNWGIKIVNYHKSFKEQFNEEGRNNLLAKLEDVTLLIEKFQSNFCHTTFTQLKQEFETILKSAEIHFYYTKYQNKENIRDSIFVLDLCLNTCPDIHEIGLGKTEIESEINVIQKMIKSIKCLLQ